MAKLVVLKGGTSTIHQLSAKTTLLGRREDCDFVLVADGVSRQHAQVVNRDEETYVLEDLGSVNGTYVNGNKVAAPYVLKDQDRIRIGSFLIRFEDETPDTQPNLRETGTQTWSEDLDSRNIGGTVTGGFLTKEGKKKLSTSFPELPPRKEDS